MDPTEIIMVLALVVLIALIFWSVAHKQVSTAYSALRVVQFSPFWLVRELLSIVGPLVYALVPAVVMSFCGLWAWWRSTKDKTVWLPVWVGILASVALLGLATMLGSWFDFFLESDKNLMEFGHLTKSSFVANIFTAVVMVIPFAVWIAKRSLDTNLLNENHHGKFKDYTLHTFSDLVSPFQPHVALFRKIDLTFRPINSGKYAMDLTEKQFATMHRLLDRGKVSREYVINAERAGVVFREQLGRPWRAIGNLTATEYAVFAALIPRIAATDAGMDDGEYDDALEMTARLVAGYWKDAVKTYSKGKDAFKLDLTLAKTSVQKYANKPLVRRYFSSEPKGLPAKHAYVLTVLYAMLQDARTLGVLAPADFRWLRVLDRRLWAVVDNVGRIVATTECAGVFAHYLAETKRARYLEKPAIDPAVSGLSEAIEGVKFSDIEADLVEKQLGEGEQPVIDPAAVAKPEQRLFLSVSEVSGLLFQAVLLDEKGDVVLDRSSKVPVSDAAKKTFGLTESRVDDLRATGVEPGVLKNIVIDRCIGNHVVMWSESGLELLPGLGRAARTVTPLARTLGLSDEDVGKGAVWNAQQKGVYSDDGQSRPYPDYPETAWAKAGAVRELWVLAQLKEYADDETK